MEKKKNSTVKMRFTCAMIFVLFTYLYLDCYQGDVLAVAQHVLSEGVTDYSYTLAPILMTMLLFLLQLGVYVLTRLKRRFHALTYFPSLLILAFVTDVSSQLDRDCSLGAWWFVFPLALLFWGAGVWVAMQLEPYEPETSNANSWLTKVTWQNTAQLLVMFLAVTFVCNSNRVFHERMKMERLMRQGLYAEALNVGRLSEQTDSSLTMLRIACMHQCKNMGDKLFTYPIVGGRKAMIPDSVTVRALMWKSPRWMHPAWIGKRGYKVPVDYTLCGYLLDKDLDHFVVEVQKHYHVASSSLPRHYKEALMLYTHRRTHPKMVYRNNVMEADLQDYQQLEHKFSNPIERQAALRDTYGNTYWYYYQYGKR